ncbi:hypothetical protein [Sabulicella glaciei]|uniref:Uncharacterized protein n=1 Tax=Sabulicella glaciei TaxID=2984948 RepID=A0ABT3P0C3_9PROT|nr:hypothetical protein [Roseococcus sp. MDT2-1-1]MCW8087853.1 hypothetical protein [Roseococcus sp. MDT2-1-1]
MNGRRDVAPRQRAHYERTGQTWMAGDTAWDPRSMDSQAPVWMIGSLAVAWLTARMLLWWRPELVQALGQ